MLETHVIPTHSQSHRGLPGCVSILLCMVIIVFLTYNWRVFVAIKLTVLNIIFSLLAMFVVFGWKLGRVVADTVAVRESL